jgi:hypothetical protein
MENQAKVRISDVNFRSNGGVKAENHLAKFWN